VSATISDFLWTLFASEDTTSHGEVNRVANDRSDDTLHEASVFAFDLEISIEIVSSNLCSDNDPPSIASHAKILFKKD
tara:strand:+ start:390 stop:623 length:234 start_codon:yes stop_codon:yes gene_type:complete